MTDIKEPFADLDLKRAIDLRWILRDIKAKRFKLSPLSGSDMQTLIELGLIKMRDEQPELTKAGLAALS